MTDAKALAAELRGVIDYDAMSVAEIEIIDRAAKLIIHQAHKLTPGSPIERAPTTWAYEQACAALDKHRARADLAEARLARVEEAAAPFVAQIDDLLDPDPTDLAKWMHELADAGHERAVELREKADAFDAAAKGFYAETQTVEVKPFMGAWARAKSTLWRCGACGRVSSIDGAWRGLHPRPCGDCEGRFFDERDVQRQFGAEQ